MSNIKKALTPNLKGKEVNEIVALVHNTYESNGLSTELELQFIQLKINESPQLTRAAKSNPESLYNSILQAAESGLSLNPQWQEGYLVPYNMKVEGKDIPTVTFSPMYRGKKKLLISKGIVKNIIPELVYEGEYFEEDIINGIRTVKHKPNSFKRSDHSKIIGGYASIFLNNGEMQYIVKGRDYFERCLTASKNKMGGKTSPAWNLWFDSMCLKCLINAADSVIPKIGVNQETTKLLNDINTNDVDYVDVTNEEETTKIPEAKKVLSEDEFTLLVNELYDYEISFKSAQKKYRWYEFTADQKAQLKAAGTIDEKRLSEIIDIVITETKELNYFEFYLDEEQFETLKQAVADNELSKQE